MLVGVLVLVTWLVLGRAWDGDFGYLPFSDRDLVRGLELARHPQWTGAELGSTGNARVPGPLLSLLFGLPQWLGGQAQAVYALQMAMYAASAWVMAAWAGRVFGWTTGLIAALLFVSHPTQLVVTATLWNPGMVPLFSAATVAGAGAVVATRDARWAILWAAAALLGAQLHLSVLLLAICCLPAMAWSRPRHTHRSYGAVLLLGLVLTAPYLIGDGLHGWANTRELLQGNDHFDDGGPGSLTRVRDVLSVWSGAAQGHFLGASWLPLGGSTGRALQIAVSLAGPAAVLATLRLPRPWSPRDRVLLMLGSTTALYLLAMSMGGPSGAAARHLQPALAASCAMNAVALARGAGWLAQGHRGTQLVLAVVLGTVVGLRWDAQQRIDRRNETVLSFASIATSAQAVQEQMGWTVADLAGRTVWADLNHEGARVPWNEWVTIDHMVKATGAPSQGSLAPPCALVLSPVLDAPWEEDPTQAITRLIGDFVQPRQATRHVLPQGWTLWTYDTPLGLCPTTTTQRYIDTPVEAALRLHFPGTPETPAWTMAADIPRFGALLYPQRRSRGPIAIAVDLLNTPQGLEVTLHSNQLRGGGGDNSGWMDNATLLDPTLVFTQPDGTTQTVVLAHALLGLRGLSTPLTWQGVSVPPGTWSVRFEAQLHRGNAYGPWPPVATPDPTSVLLTPAWSVP